MLMVEQKDESSQGGKAGKQIKDTFDKLMSLKQKLANFNQ